MYNWHMGNVNKSNFLAHLEHYSLSATMQCKKWWKRLNTGLYDIARTNAMIAWTTAKPNRTHAMFMDELINQYVNNRLDDGYSWKEMRTGIPSAWKTTTRFSAAVRKSLVDRLVAGNIIRPAMLKELSLDQVEDMAARVAHEPILYEQSNSYLTKVAVHGDNRVITKDKKPNRYGFFFFFLVFNVCTYSCTSCFVLFVHRIRKRCVQCLKNGKKEIKTQFCCPQCGDVSLCMQDDLKNSCWTQWHKQVHQGMAQKKDKK